MLLSDSRSKIWLPLLYAVITRLVNLSLSGSREEGGVNWFSCCTSSLAPLLLVQSQRPWKPSSLCVRLQKETVLVAPPSDVILITLHSYLTCHSSPFIFHFIPAFTLFLFFPHFYPFALCLHLLCRLPASLSFAIWHLPSSSSDQTSTVKRSTTDKVNHAVCDWQLRKMAVAAHRGMENPFSGCTRVGPCAHLSAENRSADYQSQLTPSQPRRGLAGRGKAQSNTNKHEDQQMARCQSSWGSIFFLNLTTPLSVLHLYLRILILTIQ